MLTGPVSGLIVVENLLAMGASNSVWEISITQCRADSVACGNVGASHMIRVFFFGKLLSTGTLVCNIHVTVHVESSGDSLERSGGTL